MSTSQERGISHVACHSEPSRLTSAQYARALAMQDAMRRAEAAHPRENAPKAGQIRSLGLLGKEDATKEVLGTAS